MATRIRRPFTRRFSKQAEETTTETTGSAAPVVATSPASEALQGASDSIRSRTAEDELEIGSRTGDGATPRSEPRGPGQQTNDSGVNTGVSPTESEASTRRGAPGSDSDLAELDAATEAALSELANARAEFKGPLDVFEAAAAAGESATPDGSGRRDLVGARPDDLFGSGTDGGQEHAAEVAEQIASGGTSLFGDRRAGVEEAIAIGAGLIGDQQARATSPSVAQDGGALADAIASVTPEEIAKRAAQEGVTPPAPEEAAPTTAPAPPPEERGALDAVFEFFSGEREFLGTAPKLPGRDFSQVDDGLGTLTDKKTDLQQRRLVDDDSGPGQTTEEGGFFGFIKGILQPKPDSATGGGVKDPGDPDLEGGPPSEAQIAFRESLRRQLGVRPNTGGDIDPNEDGTPIGSAGPIADLANNNESLIGQPVDNEPRFGGGHTGPLPGGTDVDPLEGSAFTGPSRGGNPEDLDFGGESLGLGLDAARRTSTTEDDEEEEDDEEDGGE